MTYNHIRLSQKEPHKRKMIKNGSDINAQEKLDVRAFQFLLPTFESGFWCSCNGSPPVIWIIYLYLSYQVYFVIIIVEFLFTVLSITYLRNIFRGWTVPSSFFITLHGNIMIASSFNFSKYF